MNKRFPLALTTVLLAIFLWASDARSQQGIISIDRVNCLVGVDTVQVPTNLRAVLRYRNTTDGRKVDVSNGYKVSSPDGAVWDSVRISPAHSALAGYFDVGFGFINSMTGPATDTVGFIGVGTTAAINRQLPAAYNDTAIAITVWGLTAADSGKHICIDSSFLAPGTTWKWVRVEGSTEYDYAPVFQGSAGMVYNNGAPGTRLGSGYCFTLWSPSCTSVRVAKRVGGSSGLYSCPCLVCCVGTRGNVNSAGIVDLSDLSALVSYLTGGGYVLPCEDAANVNGAGIVDLSDLSALVSFLTGGGYSLPSCP